MKTPTLIYCAGKNPRFDAIATDAGFRLGVQLPQSRVSTPLFFADQDWKHPQPAAYLQAIARYRPTMATVLDLEHASQLADILAWAEDIAQYTSQVIIIPKVPGIIPSLPRTIGQADVVLGYSVPTRYGGTPVPVWEFRGWPIHLLGGSPTKQKHCAAYMDVVSADGNYANLVATHFCKWFDGRTWHKLTRDGQKWGHDAPYECFRRSCQGILSLWAQS